MISLADLLELIPNRGNIGNIQDSCFEANSCRGAGTLVAASKRCMIHALSRLLPLCYIGGGGYIGSILGSCQGEVSCKFAALNTKINSIEHVCTANFSRYQAVVNLIFPGGFNIPSADYNIISDIE